MAKYLKKFENHAAYEAAQSGLILPNVSLCVSENEVHYNPSTPPTPSMPSIVSVDSCDGILETPPFAYSTSCGSVDITFSRPITYNELKSLKFQIGTSDDISQSITANAFDDVNEGRLVWQGNEDWAYMACSYEDNYSEEDAITTVHFTDSDSTFNVFNIFFE